MSRANAAFSLPPGDRDDAALAAAPPPISGAGQPELLPGSQLALDALDRAIAATAASAQQLMALRVAVIEGDMAAIEASALRLEEALKGTALAALARTVRRDAVASRQRIAALKRAS